VSTNTVAQATTYLFDRDAQRASTVETGERLSGGDEYFDLQQFVQDARQGYGTQLPAYCDERVP
jgi:hypothetical protein